MSQSKVQVMVERMSALNPFSGVTGLEEPPRPDETSIPRNASAIEQIPHIQRQLDILTYNHMPKTFFSLEKHRPLQSILSDAKEILREALPIRCLEATFVGLYLTQGMKAVDRIPLAFKSRVKGNCFRHIVLVVRVRKPTVLYGAIGLSRKRTLMYKPMNYTTLYDLVMEYKREYELLGHELLDVKLGLAVPHAAYCSLNPCWRFVALRMRHFDTSQGLPAVLHDAESMSTSVTQLSHSSHHERLAQTVRPTITSNARASEELTRSSVATLDPTSLRSFLQNYARLLHTMSDQYYKRTMSGGGGGVGTLIGADGRRGTSLCFMDLDEAEADARWENRRRIDCITRLQSPLSPEARAEALRCYAALLTKRTSAAATASHSALRTTTTTVTSTTSASSSSGTSHKRSRSAVKVGGAHIGATPTARAADNTTPRVAATASLQSTSSSTSTRSPATSSLRSSSAHGSRAVHVAQLVAKVKDGGTRWSKERSMSSAKSISDGDEPLQSVHRSRTAGGGGACVVMQHDTILVQVRDVSSSVEATDSDVVGMARHGQSASSMAHSRPPTPHSPCNATSGLSFGSTTLRSTASGPTGT